LHLVGNFFPHINEDARSKSHQIPKKGFEEPANHTLQLAPSQSWFISAKNVPFFLPKNVHLYPKYESRNINWNVCIRLLH